MVVRYTVGIDEVGRGPLAGPVAVCAVQWISEADPTHLMQGIRDSKKMTPKNRAAWMTTVQGLSEHLQFALHLSSARVIDEDGITGALKVSANNALSALDSRHAIVHVFADKGLPVPDQYAHTSIVKGDAVHPLISLASVIAKVFRDDLLCRYDTAFPHYRFAQNKGYGTVEHRAALQMYGITPLHRKTFLSRIVN